MPSRRHVRAPSGTTQRELAVGSWQVRQVEWPGGRGAVRLVSQRVGNEWVPWVVEAPSALLGERELGLYAARRFRQHEYVGKYTGEVVGHFSSLDDALASHEAQQRVRAGADKLLVHRNPRGGFVIVDGDAGHLPLLFRMNDPRGSLKRANVEFTQGGWVKVVQREVAPFDFERSAAANAGAELRVDYGDEYWS